MFVGLPTTEPATAARDITELVKLESEKEND
jgi:hypothetical protein